MCGGDKIWVISWNEGDKLGIILVSGNVGKMNVGKKDVVVVNVKERKRKEQNHENGKDDNFQGKG